MAPKLFIEARKIEAAKMSATGKALEKEFLESKQMETAQIYVLSDSDSGDDPSRPETILGSTELITGKYKVRSGEIKKTYREVYQEDSGYVDWTMSHITIKSCVEMKKWRLYCEQRMVAKQNRMQQREQQQKEALRQAPVAPKATFLTGTHAQATSQQQYRSEGSYWHPSAPTPYVVSQVQEEAARIKVQQEMLHEQIAREEAIKARLRAEYDAALMANQNQKDLMEIAIAKINLHEMENRLAMEVRERMQMEAEMNKLREQQALEAQARLQQVKRRGGEKDQEQTQFETEYCIH